MPLRHCRPRPLPSARRPLVEADDALALIGAVDGDPPLVVVVGLDEHRCGLFVVAVDGASGPDAAGEVLDLVLDAARPHLAAVVLGSVEPGPFGAPPLHEVERLGELRAWAAGHGVVVVDWFVLRGGVATSLAELGGLPAAWQP